MTLKKITEDQLAEILQKHNKWLNDECGGRRATFTFLDLRNVDLSHTNLRYAEFPHSNLSHANLSYADLYGANPLPHGFA